MQSLEGLHFSERALLGAEGEEEGRAAVNQAAALVETCPELMQLLMSWARIYQPISTQFELGQRQLVLDLLALAKCQELEPQEVAELLELTRSIKEGMTNE